MASNQKINKDDLKKEAKARGERLVFLLKSLKIPEEQKQAWMTLLPEMSFEEINQLIEALEEQYVQQQTKNLDEEYKADLEAIKQKTDEKKKQIDQDTINQIDKLIDKI